MKDIIKNTKLVKTFTKRIKIFVIALLTLCPVTNNAQWQYVGNPNFAGIFNHVSQNLAFNGNIPYVAFVEIFGFAITVMKYEGGNWEYVGNPGISNGFPNFISLAINDSIPFVTFSAGIAGYASLMKFNGSAWEYVGNPDFTEGPADYTTLAFNQDIPFVAFRDFANERKASVMKFNESVWVYVGNPRFSEGEASYLSLKFIGTEPYLAFEDGSNENKTTVMKFDGSSWINVGNPGFSAGEATYQSLCVIGNTPFVAFKDYENGGKTTVMKFDNNNWMNVGSPGFSEGEATFQSIAFTDSTPYVGFVDFSMGGDVGKPTVMKFNGSAWVNVGNPLFSLGYAEYTSLALNESTPYIAFEEINNLRTTSVMKFVDMPLPVELSTFSSSVNQSAVILKWTTSSEINNSGFDIERKFLNGSWVKAGFVEGYGTSTLPVNYSFTERNLTSEVYNYRLKQIDMNGNFQYYNLNNDVTIGVPSGFKVSQNYPNPFNPTTNLEFEIPEMVLVTLQVYDASGKEVATLINEVKSPGYHSVNFNAAGLSSGIYYYKVSAGNNSATKKMILVK